MSGVGRLPRRDLAVAVAIAWAIPCALIPDSARSQTTVLRGRVVTLDGTPATNARLQIVGQAPLLAVRVPSGEFEQPLSGNPAQVEMAVLDGPLRVLFPVDGIVPIPRDPNVVVTIVVGKPESTYISEALAGRLLRLESTLRANGVRFDAGQDSLSRDLHRVLERLDLRESDLREDVQFQREQAATKPEIMRSIDAYIRELKDLRDGFRLYALPAIRESRAVDTLELMVTEYNAAFTLLNDNRRAYESKILSYWTGERAHLLEKYLSDVYLEAVENIHKALVLPVNPSLTELNFASGRKRANRKTLEQAAATLTSTAGRLDARIVALEQRASELRDALEQD